MQGYKHLRHVNLAGLVTARAGSRFITGDAALDSVVFEDTNDESTADAVFTGMAGVIFGGKATDCAA